jgi:hypothetical protein
MAENIPKVLHLEQAKKKTSPPPSRPDPELFLKKIPANFRWTKSSPNYWAQTRPKLFGRRKIRRPKSLMALTLSI